MPEASASSRSSLRSSSCCLVFSACSAFGEVLPGLASSLHDTVSLIQFDTNAEVQQVPALARNRHQEGDIDWDADEDGQYSVEAKAAWADAFRRDRVRVGRVLSEKIARRIYTTSQQDSIWEKMRHLYPHAPASRPSNYAQAVGDVDMLDFTGVANAMEGGIHEEADVGAGELSKVSCIQHFGANRSFDLVQNTDFKAWNYLKQFVHFYCTSDEGQRTVTCVYDRISSTYKYTGEYFGCVPLGQADVESKKPTALWGGDSSLSGGAKPANGETRSSDSGGVDPDGASARIIDALTWAPDVSTNWEKEPAYGGHDEDTRDVREFVRNVVEASTDTYACLVYVQGKVVEWYNQDMGIENTTRLMGWSLAKGVLSLLAGLRQADGHLNISELARVPELTEEERIARGMTVENLMNMRIGRPLAESTREGMPTMILVAPDAAAYAANGSYGVPGVPEEPGRFYYASGNANLVSRELRYSFPAGPEGQQQYAAYPWQAIFSKIGARSFQCEGDREGTMLLSSFCQATGTDWIKLAMLLIQEGEWGPEQVVPSEYYRTMKEPLDKKSVYTHMLYRMDLLYGWPLEVLALRGVRGSELIIVPLLQMIIFRSGLKPVPIFADYAPGHGFFDKLLRSRLR